MGNEIQNLKQKAVKDWVMSYSDVLYSWALTRTSSVESAEDIVQETFLSAFASYDNFQNKSNPKTWLFSILNNKINDFHRKSSKRNENIVPLTENQANQYSDSLFDNNGNWESGIVNDFWDNEQNLLDNPEFNKIMGDCIQDLPYKWQLAITSKYLQEKDSKEICQELNLSTSNYWQVIHRAKLLLRSCIEKHWK